MTNGTDPKLITRTWLATDACGNTNTCSQTVTELLPGPVVVAIALTSNGEVQLSFPTANGITYLVEYKDSLTDPSWITLTTRAGDGLVATVLEPRPFLAARFYRVHQLCP